MPHRENMPSGLEAASWLVAGGRASEAGEPLNVPMVPASNFVLGAEDVYVREAGTATWRAFEEVVGGLENGHAIAFSSGMAAVAAIFEQLPHGATVVLPADCYQGVVALAESGAAKARWQVERLPIDDTAGWTASCARADLLWLESPSNPLLVVGDLPAICAAPRKEGSLLVVDNTFATPLNQQPLALGADISLQSATKFLGGHSDLLAGVISTRSRTIYDALREARQIGGATPGTLEMYLALRGLRTLALRLERAQDNAAALAERLSDHPGVERVRYPGLAAHPTHAVARRSLNGFGSMLSFDVRGGAARADRLCRALKLVQHATSLGGVESTLERRAAIPGQEHLPPGLLRMSVGIESLEDIWTDLDHALGRAAGAEN